ncbi:MAG TPA: outer membrane beta-barrel protein [Flavisolibacter sp.]|nr:outer membrane beta-barrel protein [Flavisolibacter sp.]
MQLQNNDIDDIFKRAAEGYPLKTDRSDWNKISAALNTPPPLENKNFNRFNKRNLLLFLLLLPGLFIRNADYKIVSASTALHYQPKNGNSSTNKLNFRTGKEIKIITPVPVAFSRAAMNTKYNYSSGRKQSGNVISSLASLTDKDYYYSSNLVTGKNKNDVNEIAQSEMRQVINSPINKILHYRSGSLLPVDLKNIPDDQLKLVTSEQPIKIKGYRKLKHFYIGLLAGPDFSNVKFQKVESVGLDAGILFGYKFGKKWALETGFLSSKKNYYTEGAYFNTSKIPLPQYTTINSVSGNCRMYEIPLTVRYNISTSAKKSWFAAAGVSSYLMKSESYKYQYYNSYYSQVMEKSWSANSSEKSWISVMYLSAGYSQAIGRQITLRIEPYLKLPIKRVGIGDLQIISSGIHFSITKDVF